MGETCLFVCRLLFKASGAQTLLRCCRGAVKLLISARTSHLLDVSKRACTRKLFVQLERAIGTAGKNSTITLRVDVLN